tara:strand:- start:68 stop:409 length:342 start_codon:yes stop_codon:yes gene_type:complete
MGENFEWNLSKSEIDEIAFKTIVSILEENGTLEINKLIQHLLSRTKNVKSKKYNKNIIFYLKLNHKGIIKFIENYFAFNIIKTSKSIHISLIKDNLDLKPFVNDWIVIGEEDY